MKLHAIVLFSVLFTATAPAFADGSCVEGVRSSRNLQIQTVSLSKDSGGECVVMLTPVTASTSYRFYIVSQRGVVQIFNDFDVNNSINSKATGARSYFFFPRHSTPSASVLPDGNVQVTTSSGVKLNFNSGKLADSGDPAVAPSFLAQSDDPILVDESPEVIPSNNGGVELTQTPASATLILDTGFMMGNASFTNRNGSSTFTDPLGVRCVLKNTEIFSYSDSVDPQIAFAKDADLWAFLSMHCPELSLPPL